MESHEGKELSAVDALASVQTAREAVIHRISLPWTWDAAMAASIGVFMGLIAYASGRWTAVVIAVWMTVFLFLQRQRQRRSGVVADGCTRRTFDSAHLLVGAGAMAVFTGGLVAGSRHWEWWPVASAGLAAGVIFVGNRWIHRRAIARVRSDA